MIKRSHLTILFIIFPVLLNLVQAQNIITLTWNDVVGISRLQNLDLKMQEQDFRQQRLHEWKALSDFLPIVSYQYQVVNNIERPVFVIPGFGQVRFGTEYNFSHNLQIQFPIFTGGARWANWRIQRNYKKSLAEQLKNKEDEVVLQALQAYFGVMLSNNLIHVNERAKNAAEVNYDQVKKFYDLGAASQLDLLRAKSRLSSSIPPLTSAVNDKRLGLENLKFILNIATKDSLIILDSLRQIKFLQDLQGIKLDQLQQIALAERSDLKSFEYQRFAVKNQKTISASKFLPSIVFNANIQHQAQVESRGVSRDDFVRSKNASIVLQFPLFQGGKRVLDIQQAFIADKKISLQLEQYRKSILLDVENSYNKFQEAESNLVSLFQATEESREALRLANLTYNEGISTQVDVLGAQLAFTNSEVQYQQGVYQYNITQLQLLKAIGRLNSIWNKNYY